MANFLSDLFNPQSSRFYDDDDTDDAVNSDLELDDTGYVNTSARNVRAQNKQSNSVFQRGQSFQKNARSQKNQTNVTQDSHDEDEPIFKQRETVKRTDNPFFDDENSVKVASVNKGKQTPVNDDLDPFAQARAEQQSRKTRRSSFDNIDVTKYASTKIDGVTSIYPTMNERFENEKNAKRAKANDPRRQSHASANPQTTIKVFRALCFEDTKQLVSWLKEGYTVVVDFSSVNNSVAERMMDYIMGALDVTNGFWYKIVENVIIFLDRTKNVEESGRFADLVDWTNYLDHMVNIL